MNKKIIFSVIALLVIGGGAWMMTKGTSTNKNNGTAAYCSPEGTLSETMPIQSHRSYCIKSELQGNYSANSPSEYAFSIVDDQGNTLKGFEITHTKPMHVIVVRNDLQNFQHVHPEFDSSSGMFTLKDLNMPQEGVYRIFADFAPRGGMQNGEGEPLPVTISQDVRVGANADSYSRKALGNEERNKTFDAVNVSFSTNEAPTSGKEVMLTFDLKQNNASLTDLQEYLGALGHTVILKEGTLDFIHGHPMTSTKQNGKVEFMVTFPEAGKYKVFTQFQRGGKVTTTDFVVSVAQGTESGSDSMNGME